MKRLLAILILATYTTLQLQFPIRVAAQVLSDEQQRVLDAGIDYVNTEGTDLQYCANGLGSNVAGLPTGIPSVWRNLIMSVAGEYPTADPRLVAATLWVENRGWPQYKSTGWSNSSAGAQGPWQFMPGTWASMGTDGNGDGVKDPNEPRDAVHAAFKHQLGSMGKPIAVTGYMASGTAASNYQTTVFERTDTNLLYYMAKYNGSGAPSGTLLKNFSSGQNSDYVVMSFWLLASNFEQGWDPAKKAPVDAGTGALFTNTGTGAAASGVDICATSTVSIDGHAWPVAPATKSGNGGVDGLSNLPCNSSSCHHDNTPAFDLGRQPGGDASTGAAVYAISDATIKNVRASYQGIAGCQSIQVVSTTDGFWYWYGHIQNVTANENQKVTVGTQVAIIGQRKCTGNGSLPHLHIDRGCIRNGVKQAGGSVSCRDPGMIDLINSLYKALPE